MLSDRRSRLPRRYCEREGAATAFLAAFVVSWVATRLTLFPCVVIRSVMWDVGSCGDQRSAAAQPQLLGVCGPRGVAWHGMAAPHHVLVGAAAGVRQAHGLLEHAAR